MPEVDGEPWPWPWLTLTADDPIHVEVGDPSRSGVTVRIPLDLRAVDAHWIEHARERLRTVRAELGR